MTDKNYNPLSEEDFEEGENATSNTGAFNPLSGADSENYNPLSGTDFEESNEMVIPETVDGTEASLQEIEAAIHAAKDQMQSLLQQMQDLNGAATALRAENQRLRSEVAKFQKLAFSNDAASEILEAISGNPEANEFAQMLLVYNPDAMILAQIMHDAPACVDEAWQQLQQRNLLSQLPARDWTMVIGAVDELSTVNRNQLAQFLREQLEKGNQMPFKEIESVQEVLDALVYTEKKDGPDL